MPNVNDRYSVAPDLLLGKRLNNLLPHPDQGRQRAEAEEILHRLRRQPGVILADEVGMGKTFVALAVAYSVGAAGQCGPVVVMVPPNLLDKWEQDLKTFCGLYLAEGHPMRKGESSRDSTTRGGIRYELARHSVEFMKLLDDPPRQRCQLVFLAHGAMGRRQTDKWVRLALIGEALRRHGRGKANRLIQVKRQIHRFLGRLLWAVGEERAHDEKEALWQRLLQCDPREWKSIYNCAVDRERRLADDPVPKSVVRILPGIDLAELAQALKEVPVRVKGGTERLNERLQAAREALRHVEEKLWKGVLAIPFGRSPLLILDEAHHLKNPGTALARQFQSPDSERDLRTGDASLAQAFDRMLFLTATPFQLGHHELVRVLERFGDVRWHEGELGEPVRFRRQLEDLSRRLDESQRAAIALRRSWSRLRPEDSEGEGWWDRLLRSPRATLSAQQRAVRDAYEKARQCRVEAEEALRPWLVRHNKGTTWAGTTIRRRQREEGAAIAGLEVSTGLPIPPKQLLPFFLAARGAVSAERDVLGDALCSSYEAFRFTRRNRRPAKDEQEDSPETAADLSRAQRYLGEFDQALKRCGGSIHPKVDATVRKAVDLWEAGEKVLVFAFYRKTCRALRLHLSREIERRVILAGQRRLSEAGRKGAARDVNRLLSRVQKAYFDKLGSPGRRALDAALSGILEATGPVTGRSWTTEGQRKTLMKVMRRFLRARTTLVRSFPFPELGSITPSEAVAKALDHRDSSHVSWREKFAGFIEFLSKRCSSQDRDLYLAAAAEAKTGRIRVEAHDQENPGAESSTMVLANVQEATGRTNRDARVRLMRAFNTPFLPDILVCSEVMGEGVDLQRSCRHVIHHDLAWNPSTIEQRTGRIDRLGCKAEGQQPIFVYLPYLAGTADDRQFRVMSEREQWLRVVMGQDEVARLITPDSGGAIALPAKVSEKLSFKLGVTV